VSLHRKSFSLDDLVRIPPPEHPVVLKSGGTLMNLVSVEGDNALCEWYEDNGKLARAVFPLVCLYRCEPILTE
jgi:uncharacterized protein YodC (DUF2158 family)